ncbi:hypothetical protein Hdeb2414_s0013g00414121 [Helianthus debilis subsp. tardiflorus]
MSACLLCMICNPRRLQLHICLERKVVRSFLSLSYLFYSIISVESRHLVYRTSRDGT